MKILICIVVAAFIAAKSNAIQFFLKNGEELCLSEDVPKGELLIAEFTLKPQGSRINVKVVDPTGAAVYERPGTGDGKFAHTATADGEHRACFTNYDGTGQKTVELRFTSGVQAKDYSAVAKKGNLKPSEVELKRLEDLSLSIKEEYNLAKQREEQMRITNDSTARRVLAFSFFSMFVLVALGMAQISYLKRYFQSKKLID